jgi:site-specific DNA-methyltransferase (adenine-specific)
MTHGVKPYYQDDHVTIYHGEALAALAAIPTGSVDHVVTDPPYSSGGMMRGDRTMATSVKYQNSDSVKMDDFSGDNRDQRSHAYWMALWLDECRRVAKPGAICAMFTDWRQLPTATDALQSGGWVWRGISTWGKTTSRPVPNRFSASCEFIVWGTNGPRDMSDAKNATYADGVFMHPTPANRVHMTQKPVEVMRWVLSFTKPGDVVLDPFMGSGSTIEAAKQLGCKAIGIELAEPWCAHAVARSAQEVLAL